LGTFVLPLPDKPVISTEFIGQIEENWCVCNRVCPVWSGLHYCLRIWSQSV